MKKFVAVVCLWMVLVMGGVMTVSATPSPEEDNDSYDLEVTEAEVHASSKSDVVIVLDPGHGGKDGGAEYTYNGRTYLEKDLNLAIALYCKEELENYGDVEVYLTRTADTYVSLEDRVSYAKSVGADLLVSIHNNAQNNRSFCGATVYYPNSNYNKGISVIGKQVATGIQNNLVSLGLYNNGAIIRNSETGNTYPDGSLADYYSIVRNSKKAGFPGLIVEHAYLSNQSDAVNFLSSDAKLQQLGVADADAIAEYFGLSMYVYEGIDYSKVYDKDYYLEHNGDLKAAYGDDSKALFHHFIKYGMKEGCRASLFLM